MAWDRNRFGATVEVDRLTVTYRGGHAEIFEAEEAEGVYLVQVGGPEITAYDLIERHHRQTGVTPLTIGGERAFALAARFGSVAVSHSIETGFSGRGPHGLDTDAPIVGARVEYTIVMRRLNSA